MHKLLKRVVLYVLTMSVLSCGAFGAYTKSEQIAPGLTYTKTLTTNASEALTDFFFEYTPNEFTSIEFVSSTNVYGFSTVGSMINKLEQDGKNTVAAVNADFFAPLTGVPMSAMIIDEELITSDDLKPAFAIDQNGNAFVGYPEIKAEISGESFSYEIGHINKTPTPYTVYLLTDKFSKTTKSSFSSTEIVLMPVNDEYDQRLYDQYTQNSPPENEIQLTDGEYAEIQTASDEEAFVEETENAEVNEIFNNAEGEQNKSEINDTSGEIADNASESDPAMQKAPFDFTPFFSGEKLRTSCQIRAVVTEVRREKTDGEIPEGAFVIVVDDRPYKEIFSVVEKGEVYNINVSCTENWENVSNAIGGGSVLLQGGEKVGQQADSLYTSRNPRSAIGIKDDGTIVLYACDGRRAGYSNGLTADELCERLLEIGCVDAMNFDGGGSVTCFAALPGMDRTLVNKPSGNIQRAVANAVAFINNSESIQNIAGFYMAFDELYVLCGGSKIELPKTVFTHDENYNPCEMLPISDVTLFSEDAFGFVDENKCFVSGEEAGVCTVMCAYNGVKEAACRIYVTDSPDTFTLSASSDVIDENNQVELSVKALKNGLDVHFDFEKLKCSVNGSEKCTLPFKNDDVSISAEGVVQLNADGQSEIVEIVFYAGDKSASVVLEAIRPAFYDMADHWAKEAAQKALDLGIINGIADSAGKICFAPDSSLNYAQVCAMLARFMNLDSEKFESYDFEEKGVVVFFDASTEWSLPFVAAMLEAGFINPLLEYGENGVIYFDTNALITRVDAMSLVGYVCQPPEEQLFLQDSRAFLNGVLSAYSDVSDLENDPFSYNIMKALCNGIFSGYPDGTLRPANVLTRAHMATVLVRMYEKIHADFAASGQ